MPHLEMLIRLIKLPALDDSPRLTTSESPIALCEQDTTKRLGSSLASRLVYLLNTPILPGDYGYD